LCEARGPYSAGRRLRNCRQCDADPPRKFISAVLLLMLLVVSALVAWRSHRLQVHDHTIAPSRIRPPGSAGCGRRVQSGADELEGGGQRTDGKERQDLKGQPRGWIFYPLADRERMAHREMLSL